MEMGPGKVFIGGISWETSEDHLIEYFQTFGEVIEAVIMKDRVTGRARGFGFVVFADACVAERVVKERHLINGRTVEAKKAVPRDDNQNIIRNSNSSIQGSPSPARIKKIFVGGLPSTITETDFKKYFDQFGTITDAVVIYDHNTQRPRGFGFITYDSEEAVDRVLYKTFHELNGKRVEVKQAVPRELSPGKQTRSRSLGGYDHGQNRVNTFLNGYNHGMKMPIGQVRHLLNNPSNYGVIGDISNLAYGHGTNSYYSKNTNHYGSPVGYDTENGMLFNTTNQQRLWGNGSPNYGTNSITTNGNGRSFESIEHIWGSSYENGRNGYGRKNTAGVSYDDIDSFFGDHAWCAFSAEGKSSTSFEYQINAAADVAPNNSLGYIEGYNVNARSGRGIAA